MRIATKSQPGRFAEQTGELQHGDPRITMVGVWDTVGSLGIPSAFGAVGPHRLWLSGHQSASEYQERVSSSGDGREAGSVSANPLERPGCAGSNARTSLVYRRSQRRGRRRAGRLAGNHGSLRYYAGLDDVQSERFRPAVRRGGSHAARFGAGAGCISRIVESLLRNPDQAQHCARCIHREQRGGSLLGQFHLASRESELRDPKGGSLLPATRSSAL